jgi:hypothetical protein
MNRKWSLDKSNAEILIMYIIISLAAYLSDVLST